MRAPPSVIHLVERRPIAYLASAYLTALPRVLYRSTFSWLTNWKAALHFSQETLEYSDLWRDDPVLGTAEVTDLFPGTHEVQLKGPFHITSTLETRRLLELAALAHVVATLDCKYIFEFGTFIGRMTRLLAMNAPDAEVLTLDLPQDQVTHKVGEDYVGTSEASRIRQLTGDSRVFDYSPYAGKCDFVWVDACHDYDFVLSDTTNAIEVCKPGGWIGWHDYHHTAWWSGVNEPIRAVRDRFEPIRHLRGTTIVVGRLKP
jgi:predicted O-methyltransferase YrrM